MVRLKVNESRYKQCEVYTTLLQQTKFIEKKLYWEKISIDTINWENVFDRSTEYK